MDEFNTDLPEDIESEVSSSIADALDLDIADLDTDTPNLETQGQELISEFQRLQSQYTNQVTQNASSSLITSLESKEEYLRLAASQLYAEIHKAAKKFLKTWCKINGARQIWSNPFAQEFKAKYLTQKSEFIPQVYTLSIKFLDGGEEENLAYMAPTAREATINGAKKLGFDNSTERKYTLAKFDSSVRDVLLFEDKYLKEAKALYLYQERRGQILQRHYVPDSIRDRWKKELENTLVERNGVI